METYRKYLPAACAVVLLILAWLTFFTVRETEVAFITQFGKPLYTVTDAGLHLKWPFQTANYFDRRLRIYNPGSSEFLTRDKKNLVIESYVAWKIQDPKRFVETVGDPFGAENRLHDIVWSGLSAALGTHDLESMVSTSPQTVETGEMLIELSARTARAALVQYGIEVVDVRIKRLNLPEQNKQSVYARMRAERERIAKQYRAEGEEQALSIRADADRQKEEILSVAYKEAEHVRGEGDGAAMRTYSQAYSKDPRFYNLLRTLEAYKKTFDDQTTVILSTDSALMRIFMQGEAGGK